MKRVVVTAPRGSGGATTHLRNVVPRMQRLRPDWRIEVHAPVDFLETAFGRSDLPWTVPLRGTGYGPRLRWEMVDLPRRSNDGDTVIYAPFGPLLNVAVARRAVWSSRNIIPLLPWRSWEVMKADRFRLFGLRGLVLANARLARRTICVSEHARARLVQLAKVPPSAVRVIPHGAEAAEPGMPCSDPQLETLRREPYVLSVGQATPYRRTRELIQGFRRLAMRRADTPRLVLVGESRSVDREYGDECRRLLEPLIAEGRAAWLGTISHQDVLALTATAFAVAYPSVHEDCPNAVIEALAAGRVLVCADIPATREIADNAALFASEAKADQLADALERAIYDDVVRTDLAARATARSARFTWDRAATSTLEVLEESLAGVGCGGR